MRVAFIENGDSFSWNVIDRLPFDRAQISIVDGRDRTAVREAMASCEALVIGPGPRDPVRAGLVEWVHTAAARALPLLGICLGHQALGLAFGATVTRQIPAHGHLDTAHFSASRRFAGIEGPHQVMRYHSLALEEVAAPLNVIARNGAAVVMAIEHRTLPMAGLQFHPDSYATPEGEAMLAAFFRSLP
jgi:anthranilate synthase/aminodeoxychorismate synthase-like glutamine amidotransferase